MRKVLGVALVLCVVYSGCTPGTDTDKALFYGTWQLVDFTSSGTGFSFEINETVTFDFDGTFTDSTPRTVAESIEGRWFLPEQGQLRLSASGDDLTFLGGLDWAYSFTDNERSLTLTRTGFTKELRKKSSVASNN